VAFGQQATQLVGFLPMLASELGIAKVAFMGFSLSIAPLMLGLSILVPVLTAIGAYFSRTGESAKEAATEVDEFESKIKSLDNTLKDYLRTKNAESMGITPDELTSVDAMTKATLDLASANAQLAKITNSARERAMLGGPSGGAIALFTGRAEEEAQNATILDLEAKRQDAINRINVLKQRSIDLTTQEALNSQSNYELEYTRLKFGEGSLRYKELEAKLARDAYEQEVRAKGLNVENMMAQYDAQQKVLKGLQDEFDIREVLKEQQREIAEGPQKALNIQLEYQRLLQEGVKPAEAMAEAQYKAEKALIQSKLASQDLTEEQNSALQSQLRVLDATYQMEGQIRASAIQTSLLEQGMSQSAIDALKFAGVDLSSGVSAAAAEAAILAANMNMTLSDAYSFINLVNSQVYGQVGARSNPKDFLPGGSKYTNENFKPFVPLDDTKSDGGGGSEKDVIADFQKQLELERELLGTSEAYQKVRQALGDDFRKTSPEVIAGLVQQATEIERLIELEEQRKSIMDTVKSSLEDGFMSMVDGTKSVKDAFKSMAAEIIKELYRVFVVQQIVNSISGGIGNLFGGGGAVTSSPRPMANPFPRAIGGPVIANQPYIVGERGPELVIPRSSGTVLNHDKTKAAIGGSNDVTVNNNITVTGSDAAMVRVEIAKMIPQITNATKAAVIDAKQRGGQMAAAFR
jgi:hypothetical protein